MTTRSALSLLVLVAGCVAVITGIGVFCLRPLGVRSASVTIQLGTTYQTIEGFGTGFGDSDPAVMTDAVADVLWDQEKGIGLSIFRMMIDPDGQPHRDRDDYAKVGGWDLWAQVHKALTRRRDLRVIVAGASPPAAWKDNRNLEHGGALCAAPKQGLCDGSHYAEWAASLAGFVTLAASQHPPVPVYAVSVQNEPDFAAPYNSCLYSPEQMRDFIAVLGPLLAGLRPRPKLMAPEVYDWSHLPQYIAAIEKDSVAAASTDLYAVHQYGHATAPRLFSSRRPLWQTEMSGLAGGPEARWDPTIRDGIAVAKWIHSSLVDGNVAAWLWWRALSEWGTGSPPRDPDNQDLIVDVNGTLTSKATITKRVYTLGNFSKFIHQGAVRVGVEGVLPQFVYISAYRNGDARLVLVAINESRQAIELSVRIPGARDVSTVTPWITSATDNLSAQNPVPIPSGAFRYGLAANSVTTFVTARE